MTKNIEEHYKDFVVNNFITYDVKQIEVLKCIDEEWRHRKKINFFSKLKKYHGVYVYGSVGIGKTFILNLFLQNNLGGTMRLGAYDCEIKTGTKTYAAYQKKKISERHRHRYEVNNRYRNKLEKNGLVFSGVNEDLGVVETVEIPHHPWFVGGQFHPELKSRVNKAHPLFRDFIKAAVEFNLGKA